MAFSRPPFLTIRRTASLKASQRLLRLEPLEDKRMLAPVANWNYTGVGGGGALFGPALNPHDDNQMFVSSDMSQMFESNDGGDSWGTIPFDNLQGGSRSQVNFTSDPNIMYAIDGTPDGGVDRVRPSKSVDGGATWSPLTADPTFGEVFSLKADYQDPNRLVVGGWNTLHFSDDGGATFTEIFSTNDQAGLHVGGALFLDSGIYIGTNVGVLVSTNGGQSFAVGGYSGFANDERLVSFSGASDGNATRLYAVTMGVNDVWNGVPGSDRWGYRSVYRLDPGESQWMPITAGLPGSVDNFFVSGPIDDIDTIYIAGADDIFPSVYKSTNGGTTWTDVFQTESNANIQTGWSGRGGDQDWWYGETAMGFTVDATNPDRAIITDFGFAHLTTDGGATWVNLNVDPADRNPAGQNTPKRQSYHGSGLENSVTWDLTWATESRIIASQTDIGGTISDDAGASWSFDYTGHDQNTMYRSIKHSQSGTMYAATSSIHDLYQTTRVRDDILDPGTGKVLFSTDDGSNWNTLHDFGSIVSWVAEDPTNPNRLYASVVDSVDGGVYVSNNIGAGSSSDWTRLTAPPRTEGHPFNIRVLDDGTIVASYSARMTNSGQFTASSGVFVSTDQGQSWSDRSHPDMQYWTKDIVVDPHDATQSTWYAGVWSGWGGLANDLGGLFKSTDRGQSWQEVFDGHRISSVTISPSSPDEMYMTTEVEGLWYTDNATSVNPEFSRDSNYPFRSPDRVYFNPFDSNEVWVGSFGGALQVGRTDAGNGDFNDDGQYNCADIDALTAAIFAGNGTDSFDMNADGNVDVADRDVWLSVAGENNLGAGRAYLPGDANLDGTVDVSDFNRWNTNKFTNSSAWCDADFNTDGVVDASDFNLWNGNKFTSSDVAGRDTTAQIPAPEFTMIDQIFEEDTRVRKNVWERVVSINMQ